MLYNPKWEPPKRDIFSWDNLIAWLEMKSPKQEYSYYRPDCCMLAKYFGEMTDDKYVSVGQVNACINGRLRRLPMGWNRVAETEGHTFGEALERARAANTPRRAVLRMLTFGLLG